MKRALVPLALLLAGCPVVLKPVERPYPPPSANDLIASMRAHDQRVAGVRAETKVEHSAQGQRVKLTVSILVARGGKIRMDLEGPLGDNLATLVSDGKNFALLDARQNRFMTGPANACNVARLIQLALDPEEVVEVIAGGVPLVGEPAGVSWDKTRGGREVLELRTPDGGKELVELDGRERRWDVLSAARLDAGGKVLWRVTHDDFHDQDGVRLPGRTTVEEPPLKVEAKIKFREQELNPQIDPSLFQLAAPQGIKAELVDCGTP